MPSGYSRSWQGKPNGLNDAVISHGRGWIGGGQCAIFHVREVNVSISSIAKTSTSSHFIGTERCPTSFRSMLATFSGFSQPDANTPRIIRRIHHNQIRIEDARIQGRFDSLITLQICSCKATPAVRQDLLLTALWVVIEWHSLHNHSMSGETVFATSNPNVKFFAELRYKK